MTVLLAGCGGTTRPANSVTVAPVAAAPAHSHQVAPRPDPATLTLVPAFEEKLAGTVRGIALDSGRLLVNLDGSLHVFDKGGPVAPQPHRWKPDDALVVVGDGAFDPISFTPHAPKVRAGLACEGRAFSYDASRMSTDCRDASGEEATYVYDTRTGAEIGVFKEFQTAAPVRSGTITASGNFVFWVSRATGAFEEIKTHVTGPNMSSHSVMSLDERLLFTTVDRTWYTQDQSPAQMLDPKNGRKLFELPKDVVTVFFSPSSRLFAAYHSKNWGDLAHATEHDTSWLTIHRTTARDELARVPADGSAAGGTSRSPNDDAVEAAFARDDSAVAVRFREGRIAVYELRGSRSEAK